MKKHTIKTWIRIFLRKTTGYWIHKKKYLPTGANLFIDLEVLKSDSFKTIFDVGANIGQTAIEYAYNFPKAQIYSFEPVKETFDALTANISKLKNVTANNFALGAQTEQREIILDAEPLSVKNTLNITEEKLKATCTTKQNIEVITLVDICKHLNITEIDLLKIDTEGWDLEVLKGAQYFLDTHSIKLILCEVGFTSHNLQNSSFSEINIFLSSKGYWFYSLYDMSHVQLSKGTHYANALFISNSYIQKQ